VGSFRQKAGIDYGKIFSLVATMEKNILVVAIENLRNWKIHQMDVKSTFLNGPPEEVSVKQLPGFEIKKQEMKVYNVLKQAPWNKKIDGFLCQIGFDKCICMECIRNVQLIEVLW